MKLPSPRGIWQGEGARPQLESASHASLPDWVPSPCTLPRGEGSREPRLSSKRSAVRASCWSPVATATASAVDMVRRQVRDAFAPGRVSAPGPLRAAAAFPSSPLDIRRQRRYGAMEHACYSAALDLTNHISALPSPQGSLGSHIFFFAKRIQSSPSSAGVHGARPAGRRAAYPDDPDRCGSIARAAASERQGIARRQTDEARGPVGVGPQPAYRPSPDLQDPPCPPWLRGPPPPLSSSSSAARPAPRGAPRG